MKIMHMHHYLTRAALAATLLAAAAVVLLLGSSGTSHAPAVRYGPCHAVTCHF
jgi:hypothetical protein